jgi:RNA polymerase-binding protein DksA
MPAVAQWRSIRYMDATRVAASRDALLAERAEVWEELGEELDSPEQMTYGSQAAAASQVFAQQRDLALRDAAQRRLREVEAAIARIDHGTYGRCLECGEPIAEERLVALPWAGHCIDCQRKAGPGR